MSEMQTWFRGVASPIIVAIVVGLATSYLSTQVALTKLEERLARQELDIAELKKDSRSVLVLQERVIHMSNQLERIEKKLDHNNKSMMIAP